MLGVLITEAFLGLCQTFMMEPSDKLLGRLTWTERCLCKKLEMISKCFHHNKFLIQKMK